MPQLESPPFLPAGTGCSWQRVCSHHAGVWGDEEEGGPGTRPMALPGQDAGGWGAEGRALKHLGAGSHAPGHRRRGQALLGSRAAGQASGDVGKHLAHSVKRPASTWVLPGCRERGAPGLPDRTRAPPSPRGPDLSPAWPRVPGSCLLPSAQAGSPLRGPEPEVRWALLPRHTHLAGHLEPRLTRTHRQSQTHKDSDPLPPGEDV